MKRGPKRAPLRVGAVVPEIVEPTTAIAVVQPDGRPPVPRVAPLILDDVAKRLLSRWHAGKSEDTKKSYLASARHFAAWLVLHGHARASDAPWSTIATALRRVPKAEGNLLVQEWIDAQAGMSKAAIATRCSGVHTLCDALEAVGVIDYVPRFKRPRSSRLNPRERAAKYVGVSRAFDTLVSGLERLAMRARAEPLDVRDWALVLHAGAMGLRRVELVGDRGLALDDLDFAGGSQDIHGKGRDRKESMRMPPALVPILQRWLRARESVARPDCRALYVSIGHRGRGGPIRDRSTLNAMLRRRAVQFRADRDEHGKRFAPHDMRRIFCTDTLAKYPPQKAIELTRHADVSTVQLYDLEQGKAIDAMADDVGASVIRRGKAKTKAKKKGRRR